MCPLGIWVLRLLFDYVWALKGHPHWLAILPLDSFVPTITFDTFQLTFLISSFIIFVFLFIFLYKICLFLNVCLVFIEVRGLLPLGVFIASSMAFASCTVVTNAFDATSYFLAFAALVDGLTTTILKFAAHVNIMATTI